VTFAGGAVENFVLPCPSVPIRLDIEELVVSLGKLQRQPFAEKAFSNLNTSRENIEKLLRIKGLITKHWHVWESYFASLPQSEDDPRYPLVITSAVLQKLVRKYMGDVQVILFMYVQ